MSQRLILTALKSARLNGVPFRVRKNGKEKEDRGKERGRTKWGKMRREHTEMGMGGQRKTHFKE